MATRSLWAQQASPCDRSLSHWAPAGWRAGHTLPGPVEVAATQQREPPERCDPVHLTVLSAALAFTPPLSRTSQKNASCSMEPGRAPPRRVSETATPTREADGLPSAAGHAPPVPGGERFGMSPCPSCVTTQAFCRDLPPRVTAFGVRTPGPYRGEAGRTLRGVGAHGQGWRHLRVLTPGAGAWGAGRTPSR